MLDDLLTWAEIDLDAISANIDANRKYIGSTVKIIAVVKANAYGHGSVPVAKTALAAGASYLAVHRLNEGLVLRRAGINVPILLMGYTPTAGAEKVVQAGLTPSVISMEFARALSEACVHEQKTTPIHIKVDTGMNRYGLDPEEVPGFIDKVRRLPGLEIEGLFTHFATADWKDQSFLAEQNSSFQQAIDRLYRSSLKVPLIHAANSGAAMIYPQALFTAVRLGISMYGMAPSEEWQAPFILHPALTLKSRVTRVRKIPAGSGISYGRTFITTHPVQVALIPTGYGDGYPRSLSNRAEVLLHGRRAPIRGRVCMDQFVVETGHIPGVQMEDEAVLIGRQGDDEISPDELARHAGTINYEITTAISPRVERVYLQGGKKFFYTTDKREWE